MLQRQNRLLGPWLTPLWTSRVPKAADPVPILVAGTSYCIISSRKARGKAGVFPTGYRATLEGICKAECRSATILHRTAAGRPDGNGCSSDAGQGRAVGPIYGLLPASSSQVIPVDSGVIVILPRRRDANERRGPCCCIASALVHQRVALPPAGVRLSGQTRSTRPRDPGSRGRIFSRRDGSRIRPGADTRCLARRVDHAGPRIVPG